MADTRSPTTGPKSGGKNPKTDNYTTDKFPGNSPNKPRSQPREEDSNQSGSNANNKKYNVKKRPPSKVSRKINDVYIAESSSFQSQFVKCQQLLDGGQSVIHLHGLGEAIPRSFNIANKLKEHYKGSLDFSFTTGTIKLVDDLLPTDDNTPPSQNYRTKSEVNIKIFRTVELP